MNDLATLCRPFFTHSFRAIPQLILAAACATPLACSDDDDDSSSEDETEETSSTEPEATDEAETEGSVVDTDAEVTDAPADAGTGDAGPAPNTDAGYDLALDGVWLERGYARLIHTSNGTATEYHVTPVSCTPAGQYTVDEVLTNHDRIDVNDDTLSWHERDHYTRHDFDRLDALPDACSDPAEPTARHVYEAFWHLFDENYGYFDVRGVDWDAIYDLHAGEFDDQSSDEDLMSAISLSIEPLNDGHVYVFDGVSQGFLSGTFGALWEQWATQYEGEPVTNPINPRGDFILDMQRYVEADILGGNGSSAVHGLLNWGWLEDGIGYLDLHEFYYPFEEEPSIAAIQQMVDDAMLEVTTDLADAEALVIDIRFNQGGSDSMGYAIASWLTQERVLVSRKRAVYDGGWTPPQDVFVDPRDTVFFDKPIALLQSANSISAAETFAIAMNELPQVISVGTRSYGVLSDVLQRVLPNGWLVALSNEVYEAPDGSVYEAVGVPVDVEVPYDEELSYFENLDATMSRAVAELRARLED